TWSRSSRKRAIRTASSQSSAAASSSCPSATEPVEMDTSAMTRFGDLTGAAAARWGDREALVFRERRYTFRQIAAEVDRVALGLIGAGVRTGEKVAIWLLNRPEWIFAMFALAKIGAVHVPINTRFRTFDLAQVLERSNTATLITHDVSGPVDYLGMVRELATLDG